MEKITFFESQMSKGRIAVVIPDFVRRQHEIPTGVQVKGGMSHMAIESFLFTFAGGGALGFAA